MKKFLVAALCIIVALSVAVACTKDMIARRLLLTAFPPSSGFTAQVDSVRVGVLSPYLWIQGLKVFNRAQSTQEAMLDVPELYLRYDLLPLFQNKLHLRQASIFLKEVVITPKGFSDVVVAPLALLMPKPMGGNKPPEIFIDTLRVRIGKVRYHGDLFGPSAQTIEFQGNIDETFNNVSDPSKVFNKLLKKSVSSITFPDEFKNLFKKRKKKD